MKSKIKDSVQEYRQLIAILGILVFLVIFFSIIAKGFFTYNNFINLLRQLSMLGIVSTGMAMVLISGGLDLTVGSQMSLVGTVTALLIVKYQWNPLGAAVIGMVGVALCGFINSLLINKFKMWPMIATIAMMQIIQGVCYIISGGLPVYGLSENVKWIGQGYVAGIPVPVIIMLIVMFLGAFVLKKTYIGRYLYAVGSNEEGARLSGIKIKVVKTVSYLICALLSGIAGLILMGRVASGQPAGGEGMEMDVITACVVGGIGLNGGVGNMKGVFLGVLIIGTLTNGLGVLGVGAFYQLIFKGIVLLAAVGVDCIRREKMANKKVVITEE